MHGSVCMFGWTTRRFVTSKKCADDSNILPDAMVHRTCDAVLGLTHSLVRQCGYGYLADDVEENFDRHHEPTVVPLTSPYSSKDQSQVVT